MISLILMGLKHSGKSTQSLRLAEDLHCPHFDLDALIESEYRADRLVSCREIYKRHGREYFAELESKAAFVLAKSLRDEGGVAALGGGTGENETAMTELSQSGVLIYLKDTEAALFERIMRRGLPAFLPESDPAGAFHEMYQRRDGIYTDQAEIIVEVDHLDADSAYRRILSAVRERINGGQ